jgi:thiol-disulfide isomerase/thioredoxin
MLSTTDFLRITALVLAIAVNISAGSLGQRSSPASQTKIEEKREKEENKKHGWGEGRLKPGDPAPDFDLKKVDTEQRVRLSAFAGKPVALVFGTYSCPPFRDHVSTLNAMARMYKDKVEFLLIYIREAHPADGWQVEDNEKEHVIVAEPNSAAEKEGHASMCVRNLDIRFTTLIDGMDNKTERDYSAWPDRLYLIGKDGRVAWKGGPGPKGFVPPELAVAIETELER